MIILKIGMVSVCVVMLGVMAISTSTAQAAGSWLVGTTEIQRVGSGVNLLALTATEPDTPTIGFFARILGHLGIHISCNNVATTSGHLAPEGKLSEGGKAVFTGCKVTEGDTKCTVKSPGAASGTIESAEGKGELVLHTGGVVLIKIEAKSAEKGLATIRFEGECSLPESNKVTGVLYLKDCEGKAETLAVKHLVEQGPLTSLSFGSDTAEHLETSIDGSVWMKLIGAHLNAQWRAMGV